VRTPGQAYPCPRVEHRVAAVSRPKLLQAVDCLTGGGGAVEKLPVGSPDDVAARDLISGGLRVGKGLLERRAALDASTLAAERMSQQVLGHGETKWIGELRECPDRLLGYRDDLRGAHPRIRREPLVRALNERARSEGSFAEAGCGVEACGQERVGFGQSAAFVVEVAELGLHPRTFPWVGDAELERGREPRRRFAVGAGSGSGLGRAEVVGDTALGAGDRGRDGEMVGELGQDAREIGRIDPFECLADE